MKPFHVILTAGLGNRLMGLSSAYAYARSHNLKLIVHWPAWQDCNIELEDLMEFSDKSNVLIHSDTDTYAEETEYILYAMNKNVTKEKAPLPSAMIGKISKTAYIQPRETLPQLPLNRNRVPIIWPYHYFYESDDEKSIEIAQTAISELVTGSRISKAVRSKVDKFLEKFPRIENAVTIHARRPYTHRTAEEEQKHSPDQHLSDQDYISLARYILTDNPGSIILFCSNSTDLEEKLTKELGPRIVTFKKSTTANNTREGMINAFAEMLLISMSKYCYASSAFSSTAMKLSGRRSNIKWIGEGFSKCSMKCFDAS